MHNEKNMRFDNTNNTEKFNEIADNIASCADGTFSIVNQQTMIEMFAFEVESEDDDTLYYDVRVQEKSEETEEYEICNSSHTLADKSLSDIFNKVIEHVIFDNIEEANAFYIERFVELNQLYL